VIETVDTRICCDPWFSDGIYDGAWYQFPKVNDPIKSIGPIDFVFISHIHPDHYDPVWLRKLLDANPYCRLIIGAENQRHLERKMIRDGFSPELFKLLLVGSSQIACFPNFKNYSESIDSALVVRQGNQSVVNMNDCSFDPEQVEAISVFCAGTRIAAFLPYAGAGPYPQRYLFAEEEVRFKEAEAKKERFLNLFAQYVEALNPEFAVPFAGLYFLGSSLERFNNTRGIPDAIEAAQMFPERAVALHEVVGEIDLDKSAVFNQRTTPVDAREVSEFLRQYATTPLPYENDEPPSADEIYESLLVAATRAMERSKLRIDAWICLPLGNGSYGCAKPMDGVAVRLLDSVDSLSPREEIVIDPRLLAGLLKRKYHWNNAEIGSHFEFRRFGMGYSKELYDFLSFLHI
jgi:UDP-MurNAc hydroxylase